MTRVSQLRSISSKLVRNTMSITTAVLLLSVVTVTAGSLVAAVDRVSDEYAGLAELVGLNSTAAIAFGDAAAASENLAALRADANVLAADIRRSDGTPFAAYRSAAITKSRAGSESGQYRNDVGDSQCAAADIVGRHLLVCSPLMLDGELLGTLGLIVDLRASLYGEVLRSAIIGVFVLVLGLALAFWRARRLGESLAAPIRTLADAAESVRGSGDYAITIDRGSDDEIGRLTESFNAMLREVHRRDVELRAHHENLERQVRERTAALERTVEELHGAKDAAEAANVAKSRFLANMSHELRTPLNAVIGYGEMLEEEAADLELAAFVDDLGKITQAGRHLLALINDVLDLAKIESGRMEPMVKPFALAELIDGVAATARPLMDANGNRFILAGTANGDEMRTDATRLRQILLNLLGNAAKFTHEGEVTLEIRRARRDGREWRQFLIRDTGIGMSAEQIDAVLDEFVQADSSTTREYGGTGLGLPICRRLCELLGGGLEMNSEPGNGTEVVVSLPADLTEYDSSGTQTELPVLTEPDNSRGTGTVLIIDDQADARRLLERHVATLGRRVLTADNGARGLWLAQTQRPDVILLDVMMPEMNGWSVLGELKADQRTADIPVVMCTIANDEERGYALGAADYIAKPVDRLRLLETVSRYSGNSGNRMVLVVEDDPACYELMERTLVREDWDVVVATDGVQGLRQLGERRPSLILLDLMLPEMNGFEFIRRVKAHEEWRHIPIIVVTAKSLSEAERRQLEGQVEHIVGKSADSTIEALLEEVAEYGPYL